MRAPGVVEVAWIKGTDWRNVGDASDAEPVLMMRIDGGETFLFGATDWSAIRDRIDRAGERFRATGEMATTTVDLDRGGGV